MVSTAPFHFQSGGMVLTVAIIVFLLSLAAAGGALFVLWQDVDQSSMALQQLLRRRPLPTTSPTPTATVDPLIPALILDSGMAGDRAELETQLWMPLRRYFATQPEQLGDIYVTDATADTHTARVTLHVTNNNETTEQFFFYDRSGKDKDGPYPKWVPGMLDDTK